MPTDGELTQVEGQSEYNKILTLTIPTGSTTDVLEQTVWSRLGEIKAALTGFPELVDTVDGQDVYAVPVALAP